MPFKISRSVKDLDENQWNQVLKKENPFLKSSFLEIFEKSYNPENIIPIYITFNHGVIYGHLIKIQGAKIANYFNDFEIYLSKTPLKSFTKSVINHRF